MEFYYKAKKGPHEVVEGTVEAENRERAVDKLTQGGLIPVNMLEVKHHAAERHKKHGRKDGYPGGRLLSRKVKQKDVTVFTEQLSSLLKAKVRLSEALEVLFEQTENSFLKNIIMTIEGKIKNGATLAGSLSGYPHIFSSLYINMIDAGEKGGVLDKTLIRLAGFRDREEQIKSKILSALAYPLFIVAVGILTVFILLGFVIPKMAVLFQQMDQVLPLPTRILIFLSQPVKKFGLWFVVALCIFVFILVKAGMIEKKKLAIDRLSLKLPVLGGFLKRTVYSRFCRTLQTLLENGIPLAQAIDIAMPTVNNEVFRKEIINAQKNVMDGASFKDSLRKTGLFPPFMINMIAVGEKSGSLETALSDVADFYEKEADKITKVITSLFEPVIILIMGLIVGFIVFAMLLPVFQMNLAV
ncbi:type II secretion system F family protein [bacterium]|jgi:type II secretory pathway component PulF|nr:type II secretion system F family protein [bacterium]